MGGNRHGAMDRSSVEAIAVELSSWKERQENHCGSIFRLRGEPPRHRSLGSHWPKRAGIIKGFKELPDGFEVFKYKVPIQDHRCG